MSNDLQEMENQVTRGAASAEPMQKAPSYVPDAGAIEDLGGPTPQNSRPTDDSNKLATPTKTIKQVKDVVNKGAAAADPMPKAPAYAEEVEEDDETLDESEYPLRDAMNAAGMNRAPHATPVKTTETPADKKKVRKEETEEDFEIDLEDDVAALLSGEELSEEFKEKATTIFEAAVRSKIASIQEALEQSYAAALEEEIEGIKGELVDRVDSYLEYVCEEWISENELQIESGIKSQVAEDFMAGLKGLFEEHYVYIPEERYNVLDAMVTKLDEMESKLNEQIERNVALNKQLSESVSDNILDEVSEGLALSQKDKLASLAEGVEFESEEQYREKLVTLRESYFPSQTARIQTSEEVLTEEAVPNYSSSMDAYLRALNKYSAK